MRYIFAYGFVYSDNAMYSDNLTHGQTIAFLAF